MKTNEEFKAFYQATLLPIMKEIEVDRKKLMWKMLPFFVLGYPVLFTLIGCFAYIIIQSKTNPGFEDTPEGQFVFLLAGGCFYGGGLIGFIYWLFNRFSFKKKIGAIKHRFKMEVISKMVKLVDESLHYEPHTGISHGEYEQSKIFITTVDRYHCEDMVSGKLGSTAIRFSEVHSEKRTQSGGKGEVEKWKTIFKGILFVADFNKKFNGRTVVLEDVAESVFGSIGTMFQKINKFRDPLIKMEDVEFEKAFAVYGTNSVEAHYILSPSLMKRIVEFRKKSGLINLSFIESHVYIAIPVDATVNLFEPKIYSTLINYNRIAGYNKYLMLVAGIVEDLNLNMRIWTKE